MKHDKDNDMTSKDKDKVFDTRWWGLFKDNSSGYRNSRLQTLATSLFGLVFRSV